MPHDEPEWELARATDVSLHTMHLAQLERGLTMIKPSTRNTKMTTNGVRMGWHAFKRCKKGVSNGLAGPPSTTRPQCKSHTGAATVQTRTRDA